MKKLILHNSHFILVVRPLWLFVSRKKGHGLIESDASDFHEKIYGITGLAGVRAVPVMLLDNDLMGKFPDGEVALRAGEKPVPELFEYRLEMDLGPGGVRPGRGQTVNCK